MNKVMLIKTTGKKVDNQMLNLSGFTIVELLVVIVVIGILAAITIVSYTGISSRATVASLTSDLTNASTQLKLDQVINEGYPDTLAHANNNKGILSSSGTNLQYTYDNTITPQTFCVTATKNNQSYGINQDGLLLTNACPELLLDISNPLSYPGSGIAWSDVSGKGNNATLSGGVTYSNTNGGALIFDGINGWASIPDSNSLDLVTGVTIEAWINPTSGGGTWYGILSKGNAQSYALTFNSPNTYLHFETPASNAVSSLAGTVPLDAWTYAVVTFDGLAKRIYTNGNLLISGALTANLVVNNEPLRIGQGNNGEFFKGKMANVSVYGRALSALEIQQRFNVLRGRYGI